MRSLALLALATALLGCAHDQLSVDVERKSSRGHEEHAAIEARPGGFVADVQFLKYGKPAGPVRVSVERGEGRVVELRIDYRRGRAKCVSARGYRIEVDGLDAGNYEVVVLREDQPISTQTVAVPEPAAAPSAGRHVQRVTEVGC